MWYVMYGRSGDLPRTNDFVGYPTLAEAKASVPADRFALLTTTSEQFGIPYYEMADLILHSPTFGWFEPNFKGSIMLWTP